MGIQGSQLLRHWELSSSVPCYLGRGGLMSLKPAQALSLCGHIQEKLPQRSVLGTHAISQKRRPEC